MKRIAINIIKGLFEFIAVTSFILAIIANTARADELEAGNPVWDYGWIAMLILGTVICIRVIYPRKTQIVEPFADENDWGKS